MSCAGYFETLLKRAELESFNNKVLQEIEETKGMLKRKLQSLMVQGDFHNATIIQKQLDFLEKATERLKQLLEA